MSGWICERCLCVETLRNEQGACGGASPGAASHGLGQSRVAVAVRERARVSPKRGGGVLGRARVRPAAARPSSAARPQPHAYRHKREPLHRGPRSGPLNRISHHDNSYVTRSYLICTDGSDQAQCSIKCTH